MKRSGMIVSNHMDHLILGVTCEGQIRSWPANNGSFIHMHAGDWMNRLVFNDLQWTLSPLEDWLAHWDSEMPKVGQHY